MVALHDAARHALNDPALSNLADATKHFLEVKEPAQLDSNPNEPRVSEPLPLLRGIQVSHMPKEEWIPSEWWYWPHGENTPRGPFLWDQMLGWNLQGWFQPDLRMRPSGFRRAYRLAEFFPGTYAKAAFITEPKSIPGEAEPAVLAFINGTVPGDVVAEYRAVLEGADYDWRGMPYVACERGALRVLQLALAIGADANEEEEDGSCPAHAASGHGHAKVLSILAADGANLDKPDKDGWTPAHVASSNGNGEVVWVLSELGADMNAVNEYNGLSVTDVWKTPLPY